MRRVLSGGLAHHELRIEKSAAFCGPRGAQARRAAELFLNVQYVETSMTYCRAGFRFETVTVLLSEYELKGCTSDAFVDSWWSRLYLEG